MSGDNKALTIVRVFDAPKDLVFRAWTDSVLLAQWWGPSGVTNPICEADARPGGVLHIVMLAGEELGELQGSEWPMEGVFQEVSPSAKLVYAAKAIVDGRPIIEQVTTVIFEERDGMTKMTLHVQITKATPEAAGPLAGMKLGWSQSIDKLAMLVEK